jgi:HD-like signal output (HDOD) protein
MLKCPTKQKQGDLQRKRIDDFFEFEQIRKQAMKVTCEGCKKTFKVADEKIPTGKKVQVHCPVCRSIIKLSRPEPAAGSRGEGTETVEPLKGNDLLENIIGTSRALPPMPQILTKASQIIRDENKSFQDIAEVLETDQAMATRVLRIANSAYYGLSVPASTVRQASALLGSQTLLELITIVSTSKIMGKALQGYGFSSVNVWRHTLTVSSLSRIIAERKQPALVSDAFNAGLIHDSGMIILDEYMAARKHEPHLPTRDEKELIQVEKTLFGFDHAEIAARFLKKWNLPEIQTEAIMYHHNPSGSDGKPLSFILHAAESIAQYGPDADAVIHEAEDGAFERLEMTAEEISAVHELAMDAVEDIVAGFAE